MRNAGRVFDLVLDIFVYVAFAMIIFSWLSICAEVVLRYFLNSPIIWVIEINEYLLVQITFLGTAWLLKKEGHVVVDIVISKVSTKNSAMLGVISSCIGAVVCFILSWWGLVAVLEAFQEGVETYWTLVNAPKWAVVAVIPLGCIALFVQFLRRTYGYLTTWRVEGKT